MQFIAEYIAECPQQLLTLQGWSIIGHRWNIKNRNLPIKAADRLIVGYCHSTALILSKMQDKTSLTLR